MHFWDPYNVVFIHSHTIINLTMTFYFVYFKFFKFKIYYSLFFLKINNINSDENKRILPFYFNYQQLVIGGEIM